MAHAQTPTGYSGGPVTNAAFYHIASGHQDEWLALYKKYHYPIMQYEIKQGLVKSETMYKRSVHELSPAWHFFVVIVYRDMDTEVEVQKERAKVMKAVFSNTEEFAARSKWPSAIGNSTTFSSRERIGVRVTPETRAV